MTSCHVFGNVELTTFDWMRYHESVFNKRQCVICLKGSAFHAKTNLFKFIEGKAGIIDRCCETRIF